MFIFRKTAVETIIVDTVGNDTSTAHQIEEFAWGTILLGTLGAGTTFQFFVSDVEAGTYVEIYRNGADVDVAVISDRAIKIPDEAMVGNWLKVYAAAGPQTGTLIMKT